MTAENGVPPSESARRRTLIIARHASAEQFAQHDEERALTLPGKAEASGAGEWLTDRGLRPDLALVSTATRARDTWGGLAAGAGWTAEGEGGPVVWYDRSLYSADPESVVDLLRGVPDEPGTVLVVGHNPTIGTLAQLLQDGAGDDEATTTLTTGFPAGTLAVFEYAGGWADLELGVCRLIAVHVP